MSIAELVAGNETIPSLDDTNTRPYGPALGKQRKRTLTIYGVVCFVGLLPSLLYWFTPLELPPWLVALGCGLIIPGGGFLALGTLHGLLHGLLVLGIFYLAGLETYFLFGDLVLPSLIWLFGALGGLYAGGGHEHGWAAWAPLCSLGVAALVICYYKYKIHKIILYFKGARQVRLKTIDGSIKKLETVCSTGAEPEERELRPDAVHASRFLYDLCLSGEGLRYFDHMNLPSLEGLYYQFSYVGYSLMTLQCKYTPNFHGYLSEAQRFLIESYTLPRICAYWKWEALAAYGRWQPDPVIRGNVMLAGWAYALIAGYEANTGDSRYNQGEGLGFRPFYRRDKTYHHRTADIIASFERQIATETAALIPCEPRLQFPICNSYAMVAMMAYDRFHHTSHTAQIYDRFIDSIKQEFIEMNGDIAMQRYQMTGLRITRAMSAMGSSFGNSVVAQAYNPIYPGLARRCYAIVRDEILEIRDGMASLKGVDWEKMLDVGTQVFSPGAMIASMQIVALEFGDYEMAEALRRAEEKYLIPSKLRFKYKNVSVCGMANFAAARWNRKNDWRDTILQGPPAAAYSGPLLEGCSYPDVLVAKAFSHGEDLALVLYNGTDKTDHTLRVERLQKDRTYTILETGRKIRADEAGTATLDCRIAGRTPLTLIPA